MLTERAAAPELRHALEQALRYRRPAAFLIDEAQHLKKMASGRRLLDQLDTLKSPASTTGIVHVLLGTYELLALTNLSGQLNRRTIDIHFPRYHADRLDDVRAFQSILFSLQQHLPLPESPDLVAWWEQLYERSARARSSPLSRRSRPGYCSACGRWLGNDKEPDTGSKLANGTEEIVALLIERVAQGPERLIPEWSRPAIGWPAWQRLAERLGIQD